MWLNTEKISLTMILFFLQLLFNCYFRLPVCASVLRHELCVNEFLLLRIFSFVVVIFLYSSLFTIIGSTEQKIEERNLTT